MFVRLLCSATPRQGGGSHLEDAGFACFEKLAEAGIPTRVVAINMADLGAPQSRWAPHHAAFSVPVPDEFINVVVGDSKQLARFYTVNKLNIGICGVWKTIPQESDLWTISRYDVMFSSSVNPQAIVSAICSMHTLP